MKNLLAVLAIAALAGSAAAEPRAVTGFDNVNASGRFRVEIAIGPTHSVNVEGRDAARIATRRDGDTLKIEPRNRPWFGGEPRYDALVRVTLPRLEGVAASRGANVNAVAGGDCTEFDAVAAMGANLVVRELYCARVDASVAMGANIELIGGCRAFDVAAAMGGTVEAEALRCETVDASAAMGGEITAFAQTSYDSSAAMGGEIDVSGGGRERD
jgi:Putative auto-transporter adhesin, head GIN domain